MLNGATYIAETQTPQGLLRQRLVNETSKHLLDFVGETNANKTESQKGDILGHVGWGRDGVSNASYM